MNYQTGTGMKTTMQNSHEFEPDGIVVVTPAGQRVDVHPIPGDVRTNITFGVSDGSHAVVTLRRSGRVVGTTWPRASFIVEPAYR